MQITAYTINAFAKTENGGNPAGIVLNADSLTVQQMMDIAKAIGFSETAFVMNSSSASFRVRYFTPAEEVNLCGHATIGTFSFLKKKQLLESGIYTVETNAGIINVKILDNASVMMSQLLPQFFENVDKRQIAESLRIDMNDFDDSMQPQIVSTGLRDIMIPIRNRTILDSIQPDFEKVISVSRNYHVIGYHLFTKDTLSRLDTAYCRNLAPLYGIPEEAATGTSSGALACYLMNNGMLNKESTDCLVFEQGYSMGRPSEIIVSLSLANGRISEVNAGGNAENIGQKQISICCK